MSLEDRLIDIKEVCRLTAMSKTTVYDRIRQGAFPDRINSGAVKVVWSHNEVQEWIEELKQQRAAG